MAQSLQPPSTMSNETLKHAPLGKVSPYISTYTPSLLFPIPRKSKREEIAVPTPLPFDGFDIWNAFELSWLNPKGKPQVAMAEFIIPCTSHNIVESKSFKLYLNSFNQTTFSSAQEVQIVLQNDLNQALQTTIQVSLILPHEFSQQKLQEFDLICLDDLDIETQCYETCPDFLKIEEEKSEVEEAVYSNLLKSNCLVTGQPDWATVWIHYLGPKIDHEGLLKYIISYRNHNEFHEQCIERIFMDLLRRCRPNHLSVYGRYTRRGGLDINPFRSNFISTIPENFRTSRQ